MARPRRGAPEKPQPEASSNPNGEKLRAEIPDSITASLAQDQAITAAATHVSSEKAGMLARLTEAWQTRSFTYYDLIGEIHYASNFYARGMTGVRFYAAERQEDGRIEESKDPDAIAAVQRITDPGGSGREQLSETYGRIMFIAGSGYMIWTPGETDDDPDAWEFVSTDELRINEGKQFFRFRADGLPPEGIQNAPDDQFEPVAGEAKVWRYHTPHPRLSMMADSPMRAVLDLCEELWLLTRVVRGRIKSRLAGNGILKVPIEVSALPVPNTPPTTGTGSEEEATSQPLKAPENPQSDPFVKNLIQHLVAPISDDGSASSVAPLVVRGPAAALAQLDHLALRNAEEKYQEIELRNEAIRRIALGLDMPPEALLGMADANHWTGWLIDEQTWENIRPIVQGFCRNVTSSYLIPEMQDQGKANALDFLLWYDPSDLLTDPDRGAAADAAHDRGAISDRAYRDARGFKETDAPTDEEPNTNPHAQPAPAPVIADPTQQPDVQDQGEPPTEDQNDEEQSVTAGLGAKVLGAAEMTIERARDLAGSRLASAIQGRPEEDELRGISALVTDKSALAHALGPEALGTLVTDPTSLVHGSADPFRRSMTRWGFTPETVQALAHLVELHAAMTLTEEQPRPLPQAFIARLGNGHA